MRRLALRRTRVMLLRSESFGSSDDEARTGHRVLSDSDSEDEPQSAGKSSMRL